MTTSSGMVTEDILPFLRTGQDSNRGRPGTTVAGGKVLSLLMLEPGLQILSQGEHNDPLTRLGADVAVHTHHLYPRERLDHLIEDRTRAFEQVPANPFDQLLSL